jgi:hypothetical protein
MSLGNRLTPIILVFTLVTCRGESFIPMPHELGDGASVRITVPAGPHAAGARIPLSVHNESGVEYIWNPCMRRLERRQGPTWVLVNEGDRVCTAEGWMLEPDRRTEAATDVPNSVVTGEHRFVYCFSRLDGDRYVDDCQVSNSFIITP